MFAKLQEIFKSDNKQKAKIDENVIFHTSSGHIVTKNGHIATIHIDDHETESFQVNLNEVECVFDPFPGEALRIDYQYKIKEWGINEEIVWIKINKIDAWTLALYTGIIRERTDEYFTIDNDYIYFFCSNSNNREDIENIQVGYQVQCEIIQSEQFINNKKYNYRCLTVLEVWKKKADDSQRRNGDQVRRNIVPGQKLSKRSRGITTRFEYFDIPNTLEAIICNEKKPNEIDADLDELLPSYEKLDEESYGMFFHHLLYLEEMELKTQMKRYNKSEAYFVVEGDYLTLEMQNLYETRPSIIAGDRVFAWQNDDNDDEEKVFYEGIIHKVHTNKILIKFDERFHENYKNESYSIEFSYVRSQYSLAHNGIEKCIQTLGSNFLFPITKTNNKALQIAVELNNGVLKKGDRCIPWYNSRLNKYQKSAVTQILRGELRPMPYVIYGPPGTGKTSTVIEVILQILTNVKDSRILIATQSNSAANLIVHHLIKTELVNTENLIRVASHNTVERQNVPDELHEYCATIETDNTIEQMKTSDTGLRLGVNAAYLKRFKIIIGTCIGLGRMLHMDYPSGFFTHVVIDEAGQCTEPDSLIPISFLNKYSGQVVLAGDPKQMGPIVLSIYARKRGFCKSLLDRLLQFDSYMIDKTGLFDPRLVTKLLLNYRSLPSILNFCSRQFYNSELEATINVTNSKEFLLLQKLCDGNVLLAKTNTNREHGIYFISVRGKNERVADSTSWCNTSEGHEVKSFILKLLCADVDPKDIGVITPYHLQAQFIRGLLIQERLKNPPKVGSVEEFQGMERKIILVSTVRTNLSRANVDVARRLGFIQCPQRINVAISRARALLVIFGDENLLTHDKHWNELITECVNNQTYIKCSLTGKRTVR